MCLILLAHRVHPGYPLVVAANRDEFHARPTVPATFWSDRTDLLAGRDLIGGGTWLGVTRGGRFAAVTNVREPARFRDEAPTRGALVADFLDPSRDAETFPEQIRDISSTMNGFNLLTGRAGRLVYTSNRDAGGSEGFHSTEVAAGIHGLSNAALDSPWPKVERGCAGLADAIDTEQPDPEQLFAVLADEDPAPDETLPDTGVGLEMERALSSARIRLPRYGTRSSTVVLYSIDGHVTFIERTWPVRDGVPETRRFRFRLAEAFSLS